MDTKRKSTVLRAASFLDVRGVEASYPVSSGNVFKRSSARVRAVDSVSLQIDAGGSLGLVGESGCGKSSLARVILGLVRPTAGQVLLEGSDLLKLSRSQARSTRRRLQLVAQDPYGSLDPYMSITNIVGEGLDIHKIASGPARSTRIARLLEQVHLPSAYGARRPRELSGGERQRVAIARALAVDPEMLVLDEPVSALDVSVQAQVLNLLNELAEVRHLTYLFISHDLSVVRQVCNRIAVMYLGKIVEVGEAADVIDRPLHPYTRALISAVPLPEPGVASERWMLSGDLPSATDPPNGCSLSTRCPLVEERCLRHQPNLVIKRADHQAACHVV